jgi:hypothetical protein
MHASCLLLFQIGPQFNTCRYLVVLKCVRVYIYIGVLCINQDVAIIRTYLIWTYLNLPCSCFFHCFIAHHLLFFLFELSFHALLYLITLLVDFVMFETLFFF